MQSISADKQITAEIFRLIAILNITKQVKLLGFYADEFVTSLKM